MVVVLVMSITRIKCLNWRIQTKSLNLFHRQVSAASYQLLLYFQQELEVADALLTAYQIHSPSDILSGKWTNLRELQGFSSSANSDEERAMLDIIPS